MDEWTPADLKKSLDDGKSIFLKLWKPGCGACKLSESATSRLEEKESENFKFVKINTEEYPEMMEITGTDVLPVFFVFKDGAMQSKVIGFKGIKKLQDALAGKQDGV